MEIETTIRKWGKSLGVVIPNEVVKKRKLKPNQRITMQVEPQENPLGKFFGTLKKDFNTEKMLKELDKELYDD